MLARDAGAAVIVNPVSFAGQLLAGSSVGAHVPDYVSDLMTERGRIALRDRVVAMEEVGRDLRDIATGQGLRIYRGAKRSASTILARCSKTGTRSSKSCRKPPSNS